MNQVMFPCPASKVIRKPVQSYKDSGQPKINKLKIKCKND